MIAPAPLPMCKAWSYAPDRDSLWHLHPYTSTTIVLLPTSKLREKQCPWQLCYLTAAAMIWHSIGSARQGTAKTQRSPPMRP
jgi:hypothetical protein